MNRLLSICLLMLLGTTSLWACPAFPKPADVKQPDGTVLTLCLHGDEFLSFSTTIDGYTVVKGADGFYRYAEKNADGLLKATDVIARNPEARTAAEVSFLSARKKMVAPKMSESSRQMKEMAAQMCAPAYGNAVMGVHRAPGAIWKPINYENFKGLVVLVEWNDCKFTMSDPVSFYQQLTNESHFSDTSREHYPVDVNGSVRDYFRDNSVGIFDPTFDVVGPVAINYSCTYPKPKNADGTDDYGYYNRMVNIIKAVMKEVNTTVDFTQYDLDNNGVIDMVYFIFAGYGSYVGDNDYHYLWPHANDFSGIANSYNLKYDGKKFGRYACSVELQDLESQKEQHQYLDGIGTMCHEFSHVLGLADHYDTDYEENGQSNDPDQWDVMAGGTYLNYGLTPVGYNAFERHVLGFVEPTVLTEAGTYELEAFATGNQAFILNTGSKDDDFYLENRQKEGWDRFLPGHGLLVWRADTSNPNIWRGNMVNCDANHNYFVMVTTAPNNGKLIDFTSTTTPALVSWAGQPAVMDLWDITEENGVVTFTAGKDLFQTVVEDFEESPLSESGSTNVKGVYCWWDLDKASIEQVDGSNVVSFQRSGTLTSSVFEKGIRSLAFTVKNGSVKAKFSLRVSTDGANFTNFRTVDNKTSVDIKKDEDAYIIYRNIPANSKIQLQFSATSTSANCYVDNIAATFFDNDIPTGIEQVRSDRVAGSTETYNVNGQRVNSNFKGLVIRNGRKYINK